MSKAIYAFSADPITLGHIDIIERAAKVFDEVVAAIGVNPVKNYLFNTSERVAMAQQALKYIKNVSVTGFTGLLTDFAYENDIPVIIRGLRNSEHINIELMLHQLSETQVAGIETFLIPCQQQLAHISSSAVKALQLEQGLIHEFVPLNVKQCLEERISGQLIIGVTGGPGTGKSYLIKQLLHLAGQHDIKAYSIDVDKLGHEILERSTEPAYAAFRKKLIEKLGAEIELPGGFIDSHKLGLKIFGNATLLEQFNQMIYKPLVVRLRKELYHKRGLILLESALLAETNSLFYCNNHVIVTSCKPGEQNKRLQSRGYSPEKITRLLAAQFNHKQKVNFIEKRIAIDGFGKVFFDFNAKTDAAEIFHKISLMIPTLSVA